MRFGLNAAITCRVRILYPPAGGLLIATTYYYYCSSWPGAADVAGARSAGTRLRAGRGAVALVVSGSRVKRRPKRETATRQNVEKTQGKAFAAENNESRREIRTAEVRPVHRHGHIGGEATRWQC